MKSILEIAGHKKAADYDITALAFGGSRPVVGTRSIRPPTDAAATTRVVDPKFKDEHPFEASIGQLDDKQPFTATLRQGIEPLTKKQEQALIEGFKKQRQKRELSVQGFIDSPSLEGGNFPLADFSTGQRLKSAAEGLMAGVTAGLVGEFEPPKTFKDPFQYDPKTVDPAFHTAGEFVGAGVPILGGAKLAQASKLLSSIKGPFKKKLASELATGAIYETALQSIKGIKGDDVDFSQVPITAVMFGAFGAGLHGVGKILKGPVKAPEVVKAELNPTPKMDRGITDKTPSVPVVRQDVVELRHAGLTPQVISDAVKRDMKAITKATTELIEKSKTPPEIKKGVGEALESMIDHDRQIRRAESTNMLFQKTVNDAVPDKSRQMLMVHAYEHKMKGKYWNQLSKSEKNLVRWAAKEKEKLNQFIKDNDVLELMEQDGLNHIFHWWINPKSGEPYAAMYSKTSKGLPQSKQRKIPTYEAGIAQDLVPATTNLGELIGLEWEAAARANSTRNMTKTLANTNALTDVGIQRVRGKKSGQIRMIERWDLLKSQGLSDDYVRFSHPSLDKAITFKNPEGHLVRLQGAVGVRKELYPFVNAYMNSPTYGNLMKLNFVTKSLKLGFSLFHVASLGMQELANLRIPFKNIPRGLKLQRELGKDVRLLHQEGLEIGKGYEDLGLRNKFFDNATKLGKAGNIATKPIEMMRNFIFDVVQPGMKTSFAVDKYNTLLPKMLKEGKTKEEVARAAVKMADGHFSGEHWKRSLLETNRWMVKYYFSPEARKFWQAALLSPTWQREHMLVAKDVTKSFIPNALLKKAGLTTMTRAERLQYQKYALGGVMMVGAVDMYNLMTTQQMDGKARHLWDNPKGKGFAVRAPWNEPSYEVETERVDRFGKKVMRTIKGGPAYIRPLKSVFEVAEWATDPIKKFTYKISPMVSAIGNQIFESKYRKGYEGIGDIPRRLWDFTIDVGTPISGSQAAEVIRGKKSVPGGVLPFFGFPTSRLKKNLVEKQYYERLNKLDSNSKEWLEVKKEFESFGFDFTWKKSNKFKGD